MTYFSIRDRAIYIDPLHHKAFRRRHHGIGRHRRGLLRYSMAEALNGTFKAELIDRCGPWRSRTQTEIAICEWISWCNHARIHTFIGDVPPVEYEHTSYAQVTTPAPTGAW